MAWEIAWHDISLGLGWVKGSTNRLDYRPTPDKDVVSPSDMIEAGDGILGWGSDYLDGSDDIGMSAGAGRPQRFNETQRALNRHNSCVNVVFCDGHVESPKASVLFSLSNSASLARWNKDHQPHPELLCCEVAKTICSRQAHDDHFKTVRLIQATCRLEWVHYVWYD